MGQTLSQTSPPTTSNIEVGAPGVASGPDLASATSLVTVSTAAGITRAGDITVTIRSCIAPLSTLIELDEKISTTGQQRHWTLTQAVRVQGDTVHVYGQLDIADASTGSTTTYSGGWTWSALAGSAEEPTSDVGFTDAVAEMFSLTNGAPSPEGPFALIDTLLGMIGNWITMQINYLLDLFVPYVPPTSCVGPTIDSSCAAGDVPCSDQLASMCAMVDSIPNVSDAFKQCMQARCGCGGASAFDVATFNCAQTAPNGSCGPCVSPGFALGGCNLGGADAWFCDDQGICSCANTVFHEMSHMCGTTDSVPPGSGSADQIGDWFEEQFPVDVADCGPVILP